MEGDDFYGIYNKSTSNKYFMSLNTSIALLLGSGVAPVDFTQTFFAAVGLFLGAVINANIFGELSVIMYGMGKTEKHF